MLDRGRDWLLSSISRQVAADWPAALLRLLLPPPERTEQSSGGTAARCGAERTERGVRGARCVDADTERRRHEAKISRIQTLPSCTSGAGGCGVAILGWSHGSEVLLDQSDAVKRRSSFCIGQDPAVSGTVCCTERSFLSGCQSAAHSGMQPTPASKRPLVEGVDAVVVYFKTRGGGELRQRNSYCCLEVHCCLMKPGLQE
ncbi:unnamed protein product [Pleuronectes platessa]|uniref:Uncharacterized protein n=1 Tax=Pleuronectes platessa TaxID=8262 RepID=A0A9N7VEU9_PLEPL|nr:unnamed protein product [Pleuronectes platessa]